MRDSSAAFHWIVSVLEHHNARYALTGGLAAASYGSQRPLNDIDFDVRNEDLLRLMPDIAPYITYGPDRYRDAKWDILLITLSYEGQEIDLGGSDDTKIYDGSRNEWCLITTNFSDVVQKEIFGTMVPVISPRQLIDYKNLLDGEHQAVDIAAAENFLKLNQI